ncbi:12364_t:CDS:2, partial [Gigaspora margarita]
MKENSKREADHAKLKEDTTNLKTKNTELEAEVAKLRHDIEEIKKKDQTITNTQDTFSTEEISSTSSGLSSDNNSSEQSNSLYDVKTVTLETNPKNSTEVSTPPIPQHECTGSRQTSNSFSSKVKISDSSDFAQASTTVSKKLPEILIKNESDIDTLILLLQQKFKMSKERLEQWRANIAFELRDNKNYWKKEHESMSEANFLEHKQNFEAKIGVPTTPHKKELKNKSLLFLIAFWIGVIGLGGVTIIGLEGGGFISLGSGGFISLG